MPRINTNEYDGDPDVYCRWFLRLSGLDNLFARVVRLSRPSPRNAETWQQCLDERLKGWSVSVCQIASDEAKALIALAEGRLGIHHSPDLFHVQHESVQATSGAGRSDGTGSRGRRQCPAAPHRAACSTRGLPGAMPAKHARCGIAAASGGVRCRGDGGPATADGLSGASTTGHRGAARGVARLPPIDLQTALPVTASEVDRRLNGHFDRLDEIATVVNLDIGP